VAAITHHLPSVIRTRVVSPTGYAGLERVVWITPYAAETIGQTARRAGQGARLEITVPTSTSAEGIAAVEALFAWLLAKGISVSVLRGDSEG
jgi:hypothetical protein